MRQLQSPGVGEEPRKAVLALARAASSVTVQAQSRRAQATPPRRERGPPVTTDSEKSVYVSGGRAAAAGGSLAVVRAGTDVAE